MISNLIQINSINTIYKNNQGIFIQLYMEKLQKYFDHVRKIDNKKYPQYLFPERVIYLAILKLKQTKYQNGIISLQSLIYQFTSLQKQIHKNKDILPKYILNFQKTIPQKLLTNLVQVNNLSQLQDLYLCEAIKAACNKRQNMDFFKKLFNIKKPVQYKNQDYKKIMKFFGQQFIILDYDSQKQFPENFSFDQNTSYILKINNIYYLLYQKSKLPFKINQKIKPQDQYINIQRHYFNQLEKPSIKNQQFQIKIVKKQVITPENISKYFLKRNVDQYQLIVKQLKSKKTKNQNFQVKQNSLNLSSTNAQCISCKNKFTEFQCLKWNYQNYCEGCLISPYVSTTHIPKNLIQKYFKDRNLEVKLYKINCPQCEGQSILKKYKPSNKPSSYSCQLCFKKICIKHLSMINNCFCQCTKCQTPTIHIPQMKINLCQKCNYKLCQRCRQNSKKLCKCICSFCLNDNTIDHQCEKRCHSCFNKHLELRSCKCNLPICHGCYYFFLQKDYKDGFCRNSQFI